MSTQADLPPDMPAPAPEPVAFSNSIRLTRWEWLIVAVFGATLVLFAPWLWEWTHPFVLEPDYRMPFELSNDYWLYDRFTVAAGAHNEILLIGDSVVWGPYVTRQQTLAFYLNEQAGSDRYANLGLNGAHPAALAGLLEYHASGVKGKKVLLQCNPLWLTSPLQDLQEEAPTPFNHPDLVPQSTPGQPFYISGTTWVTVPRYKADLSKRLGIVIDREVPFTGWTTHLQEAYFDQTSVPKWTLEHPDEDPLPRLNLPLPAARNVPQQEPVPWHARGMKPDSPPWVDLETSLQWHSFQRAVRFLQGRGNHVFVLVGPYNEHLLTESSKQRYHEVKATIEAWLKDNEVPHLAPGVLPRDEYGDASHPLSAGYRRLAGELVEHTFFKE